MELEKLRHTLFLTKSHLEATLNITDRLTIERDDALIASRKILKEHSGKEEKIKRRALEKEIEYSQSLEKSNQNLKLVRESYETERNSLISQLQMLTEGNKILEGSIANITREKREIEAQVKNLQSNWESDIKNRFGIK